MTIETEQVLNIIHHYQANQTTQLLVMTPPSNPESSSTQFAHIRLHRSDEQILALNISGGREFTVAWCMVPLVDNPSRFFTNIDSAPGELPPVPTVKDFSRRAVGVVFGVSAYNPNDAKQGSFFSKKTGRTYASDRMIGGLNRLRYDSIEEQDVSESSRLSDTVVLEVPSTSCSVDAFGYLELPQVGRFLYDAVRQFVVKEAAQLVSHTLDSDFDFSFDDNELFDDEDPPVGNMIYEYATVTQSDLENELKEVPESDAPADASITVELANSEGPILPS